MNREHNNQSVRRPRLIMECGFCHVSDVELIWKEYLKQYRGMCPNEACEIWSVVKEVKFYQCFNKKKQIVCSHYITEKCDHECHITKRRNDN